MHVILPSSSGGESTDPRRLSRLLLRSRLVVLCHNPRDQGARLGCPGVSAQTTKSPVMSGKRQ